MCVTAGIGLGAVDFEFDVWGWDGCVFEVE